MNLISDLENVKKEKTYRSYTCAVERLLNKVDFKDRDGVSDAIDDPEQQVSLLLKVFKAHGYEITASSLYRHRRRKTYGGCACP